MLNGHMYVEEQYDIIYHEMLKDVFLAPNHEVVGVSYTLTNPVSLAIASDARSFDSNNAEKFYQWVLSGSGDMEIMKNITKRAIQFDREVDGRNPHYGPRIAKQIDFVVDELFDNPGSRRACIMILDPRDRAFAIAKRENKNTIEYPCTVMLNYFIRNGYLHAHTMMRSNNMCSTVCYDNFIFCRLQTEIIERLNRRAEILRKSPVYLGYYYHYILNAHIITGEIKRTRKILEERYGEITKLTRVDT